MVYVYRGNQPLIVKPVPVADDGLMPCGTVAAERRHRAAGEPICDPCRDAARVYDRERKRIRRIENPVPPKQRKHKPCGTHAAAIRHYERGETLCEPCRQAKSEYEKARRLKFPKPPRKIAECGTYTGYARHRRQGEKACRPCLDAWNAKTNGKRMTSGVPNGTIHSTQQKAAA
jgi:hypothetical protein